MNTIGDNIKSLRLSLKLTQDQFAKKFNISRSYLGDLENNRRNPSAETIKKLSKTIGISTLFLLEGIPTITDSLILGEEYFKNQPSNYSKKQEEMIDQLLVENAAKTVDKINNFTMSEKDLFRLEKVNLILEIIDIEENPSVDIDRRKIATLLIASLSTANSFLFELDAIEWAKTTADDYDHKKNAKEEIENFTNYQNKVTELMKKILFNT
ncbi:helix-turn-helix domain-containing protein [Enterococcus mundtii]